MLVRTRFERASTIMLLLVVSDLGPTPIADADPIFDQLQSGETIAGFKAETVYENSAGKGVGARFVSSRDGFVVDLFQIESVPQAFFWVKSPPKWDKGEPHTCEHLLLGKGNVGRAVAALEEMSLGNSSAYTDQLLTAYHFNSVAGTDAFYTLFKAKLNALLNPDFSDEEVRREVCHIGVTRDEATGSLGVEEKGTVYTEMISNYERPWAYLWEAMDETVFGLDHPVANVSGGRPDAIRQMVPTDLWEFHRDFYHLSNMGAIVSLPPSVAVDQFLVRLGPILKECQSASDQDAYAGIAAKDLPAAASTSPPGTLQIKDYPSENPNDPGQVLFSWPADLDYDREEEMILQLFLGALANGSSSLLYDDFFSSQTRRMDLGAGYCYGTSSSYPGHPVRVGFGGIDCRRITITTVDSVRTLLQRRISDIAGFQDSSAEIRHFNRLAAAMLAQWRRHYERILDTPPQFGFRGGPAGMWVSHLEGLESVPGFRKSLVLKGILDRIDGRLQSERNIWRGYIARWRLTKIIPYAIAIKPSPALLDQMRKDKEERLAGYVAGFEKRYGTPDPQDALRRYKAEFDSTTAALDARASTEPLPPFTDNPPLTFDPDLKYALSDLDRMPLVASTFDNMTSATSGLAFDLRDVPDSLLVYLPILPVAMTEIGVTKDGQVVSYDEMETRLRQEILGLSAYFHTSEATGRVELVIRGAGANIRESEIAIGWMEAALFDPLLTADNLPRLRDVTAQMLVGLRSVMKGGEEGWVDSPFNGYRLQDNPVYLSVNSFLTQAHHVQRLKWLLADPGSEKERKQLKKFLDKLRKAGAGKSRSDLIALLANPPSQPKLPAPGQIVEGLVSDLQATLTDIPDATLAADWEYLLGCADKDLFEPPDKALKGIKAALSVAAHRASARAFIISNPADQPLLTQVTLNSFERLSREPITPVNRGRVRMIERQLLAREPLEEPIYVGLINPNTRNGVIHFFSRLHQPFDTTREGVLDALTGKLFGGGGAHSFFMQTWGAGLAYSNGISYRDRLGGVRYYAERCPDVAETMKFVVGILGRTPPDTALTDYCVALAFGESNAPSTYEERGASFAFDLADGLTPARVAAYRRAVLAARRDPATPNELWKRLEEVYGRVLIGYGAPKAEAPGTILFLIGPEAQFQSLERLIGATEGAKKVLRLYPRDFWL